jgi:hypothetical protein
LTTDRVLTPELKALFVRELERFANRETASDTVSEQIQVRIGELGIDRGVAARLAAKHQQMSLVQRVAVGLPTSSAVAAPVLGQAIRTATQSIWKRYAEAQQISPPTPQTPSAPTTYRLLYTGLKCSEETTFDRGTTSDEPYVVTSVTSSAIVGAVSVAMGSARTRKQPRGRSHYPDVDSGDWREGPVDECWSGSASDIVVISALYEHDDGDPDKYRDEIHVAVTVALAVAQALGAPSALSYFQPLIEWSVNYLVGSGDDLISVETRRVSASSVVSLASTQPHRDWFMGMIPYHFYTRHRGAGADYKVLFQVG